MKIKPGRDPELKEVFAEIGRPEEAPFQPDPFQLEALSAIETSDCLVTAPTGAGKTWIAETAIAHIFSRKGRAWYASPLKALTNGVYSILSHSFGRENVGILTGDRKENPTAPLIVGTTEILRNHLYDAMVSGEDLATDFVILDEAHFLGDEDRGVVWEEIMIYLPHRIPLLMLSATIGNARQIADWLKSIRKRKCIIVEETRRPVPLYPLFFHPSGTLLPLLRFSEKHDRQLLHKKVASHLHDHQGRHLDRGGKLPPLGDIIRVLGKYDLLPAIFFMKSRADCDNALDLCTEENLLHDPERKLSLNQRIEALVSQSPHIAGHKQRWQLEHLGVGAHHSGQLPAWKIVIETLMTEGLLDAVFATSTVAAGVNFPARSVVILNSDRYNGTDFQPLTATEFHQMTGRCGRRGKDNIGFAVMIPGKFMDLRLAAELIQSKPSDVNSQIKINFSMVLNLLMSHTPSQIQELLEKSFASFQLASARKRNNNRIFTEDRSYLWRDFLQHLNFLKQHDFVTAKDELTEDGRWTARLRIDQPLLIAEGFRREIFPDTDAPLLAGLIATFVNERETVDEELNSSIVPKALLHRFLMVKKSLRPFAKQMTSQGFETRPLCLQPAVTLHAWADGRSWEDCLRISGLSEGDLARLILRTADNLRHIHNLEEVFPLVARNALAAIEAITREPLVSFYE
ncbi:MAG: DEAD/DEAH box helicase [Thermodesulfobacteriota bacterium]